MVETAVTTLNVLVAAKAVDLFLLLLLFLLSQEKLHTNIIGGNSGRRVRSWSVIGRLTKLFPSLPHSGLLGHLALLNAKVSHQLDFFAVNIGDFGDCFGVVADLHLSIGGVLRLVFHLGHP